MVSTLDAPRKLSKLEAVNTILAAYGVDPVSAIGNDTLSLKAQDHLVRALVLLSLKPGMYFNTSASETWSPDGDGKIAVSPDVVRVKPNGSFTGRDYIQKGDWLYDRHNKTYVFSGDITVEVARTVPYDELPLAASWYVAMAACVSFLGEMKPADPAMSTFQVAMSQAAALLEQDDAELGEANLVGVNPHFYRGRGRARSRRRSS